MKALLKKVREKVVWYFSMTEFKPMEAGMSNEMLLKEMKALLDSK